MNDTKHCYTTPNINDIEKYRIRQAYKTGNSVGIILTGLLEEGAKYICWKENNDIILRKTGEVK